MEACAAERQLGGCRSCFSWSVWLWFAARRWDKTRRKVFWCRLTGACCWSEDTSSSHTNPALSDRTALNSVDYIVVRCNKVVRVRLGSISVWPGVTDGSAAGTMPQLAATASDDCVHESPLVLLRCDLAEQRSDTSSGAAGTVHGSTIVVLCHGSHPFDELHTLPPWFRVPGSISDRAWMRRWAVA